MADWTCVVSTAAGAGLGEIRGQRQLTLGVSQRASAQIVLAATDRFFGQLAVWQHRLRMYDSTGALRFYGPLLTREIDDAGGGGAPGLWQETLTFVDLTQQWDWRQVGRDRNGAPYVLTSTYPSSMAIHLLNNTNSDLATGIIAGTDGIVGTQFSLSVNWTSLMAAITELAAPYGSFEWQLRYQEVAPPYAGPPTIYFDAIAKVGTDRRTSTFWELVPSSGKGNIGTTKYTESGEQLITVCNVFGSDNKIGFQGDIGGHEAIYNCRMGDVVSVGDISDQTMLNMVAQAHVTVRNVPRVLLEVQPPPSVSAPVYGVDYQNGDIVTVRIVVPDAGFTLVNGALRIWGVQVTVDDNGVEVPQFTLMP
jgi:hypothetical protein